MTVKNFNPGTTVLLIFIFLTGVLRVVFNFNYEISPLANFSPLGAMAIFGGAYFNRKWKAFALPLLMIFLSDFILQQTVFKSYGNGFLYSGWYWVYGAFALMVMIGRWLLKKVTVAGFLCATLSCVIIHWIVTDLGVWIGSQTYNQNMNGFIACLENAIPYEWCFLTGTLLYGVILFGLFERMKRKFSVPRLEGGKII
jgi:hypothetical protein